MNEQERRKQRVYDHIGTALECIGSVLGGPYGLDLDNAVTRRICRIKLVEARDALNAAIMKAMHTRRSSHRRRAHRVSPKM